MQKQMNAFFFYNGVLQYNRIEWNGMEWNENKKK